MTSAFKHVLAGSIVVASGILSARFELFWFAVFACVSFAAFIVPHALLFGYVVILFGAVIAFLAIFSPPNRDATGTFVGDPTPVIVTGVLIAAVGVFLVVRFVRRTNPEPSD